VIATAHRLYSQDNYAYIEKRIQLKNWHEMLSIPGKKLLKLGEGVGDRHNVTKSISQWKSDWRKQFITRDTTHIEEDNASSDDNIEIENVRLKKELTQLRHAYIDSKQKMERMSTMMDKDMDWNEFRFSEHSDPLSTTRTQVEEKEENKHERFKTLSDLLYLSPTGDINKEPIEGEIPVRDVQMKIRECNEVWRRAIAGLEDATISLEGYLVTLTSSRFGRMKKQKRWFVLKGCYLTYFKTFNDSKPKRDKCLNITAYTINPVTHKESKFAFEIISPPMELHTNNAVERIKFTLMPDDDNTDEDKLRQVQTKWIKALRFSSKGGNMWQQMLHLVTSMPPTKPLRPLSNPSSGYY